MISLIVGLKIPDTTAITTLQTLQRMGYDVTKVKREIYYEFDADDSVKDKLGKIDILVNQNKNKFTHEIEQTDQAQILVTDSDDDNQGLIDSLDRLGVEVNAITKGTLWTIDTDKPDEIADKLLANRHFQEFKII